VDPSASKPGSHGCLVRFQKLVETEAESQWPSAVAAVVRRELAAALKASQAGETGATERNQAYLQRHGHSLPHALEGARMTAHLNDAKAGQAVASVTNLDQFTQGVDLKVSH